MSTLRLLPFHAIALCALFAAAAAPAHAQWKWRDANGSIQFSDRPPPISVPERDILKRPAQAAVAATQGTAPAGRDGMAASGSTSPSAPAVTRAAAAPAVPAVDPELDKRRKAEEAEKAAKAKADEERRKAIQADNCKRARSAVATYEGGQRVARVNEKGEREFLDERQRNEELQRAREAVGSECK